MVRFGPFTFDPDSGDLERDGAVERISPQAAHVLRLFLERPGAVISRGELKDRIWPDTTVEFDQGLSFCIRQLRVALGDDASNPRYIETLPKRGYRFLAPVIDPVRTHASNADHDALAKVAQPVSPGRPRSRVGWFIGGASILALAAVIAANAATERQPTPIAIVPFDADSSSLPSIEYRDRLAEAIVERLTNGGGTAVSVMGPSTTRRFRSRSPVDSIRTLTGAEYALSGVVRARGSGYEVFAQLIRAADRGHVWVARWPDSTGAGSSALGERIADSVRRVLVESRPPAR